MVGKLMADYLAWNVKGDPVELLAAMLRDEGVADGVAAKGLAASLVVGEVGVGMTIVMIFCRRFDCEFRTDGFAAYFCGSGDE
jgi:hypothetical protein